MSSSGDINIKPGEVDDVIRQLDELAGRIQHVMKAEAANLTVTASGVDEVSQRVAQTSNGVRENFSHAADLAATEIQETAATLRAHAGRIQETDLA